MAGLTFPSQILTRVSIHRNGQVNPTLIVLFDADDGCHLAAEDEVHRIGLAAGSQVYAGAWPKCGGYLASHHPVKSQHLFPGQSLRAVEQFPGVAVHGPDLPLFLFCQGQDPESQQFVYFGPVEEVTRALWCDRWVVVQDHRCGEHHVALPLLSDQHRPGSHVATPRGEWAERLRGVEQGNELASPGFEDGMSREECAQQHGIAVVQIRPVQWGVVRDAYGELEAFNASTPGREFQGALDLASGPARGTEQGLPFPRGRKGE